MERQLSRYLRLATWGLPQKKKLEIQQELRGNIEILALEYQLQGNTTNQALDLALRDFGKPEHVCAGMTKVYTMPILTRKIGIALLLSSLGLSALTSSNAQVDTTTRLPVPPCLTSGVTNFQVGQVEVMCETESTIFINKTSLKAILEPLGVTFKDVTDIKLPLRPTEIMFPGASNRLTVGQILIGPEKSSVQLDFNYFLAYEFFQEVRTIGLPVSIRGWDNPTLMVGKTTFNVGTLVNPLSGYIVYNNALEPILRQKLNQISTNQAEKITYYLPSSRNVSNSTSLRKVSIRVSDAQPNDLYIVLTRETSQINTGILRRVEFLQPSKDGQYQFISQAKSITFKNVDQNKLPVADESFNLEAVLLKFNGRLEQAADQSMRIVAPERITILKP